jgi:hypothetical protein
VVRRERLTLYRPRSSPGHFHGHMPLLDCRPYGELTDLGIIYLVPGLGYFPSSRCWPNWKSCARQ